MDGYSGDKTIYYRLIAVWVLCEAMLGGIIHAAKIPVSGLVVGSAAILCICLIGWYAPGRGAILKATVVVAIFKMMLSPQAPPPAYVAVFFQGLVGELLFRDRRYNKAACIVLAVLGLLESGLQRILILTIVYGNDLWKLINQSVDRLAGGQSNTNYSFFIAGGYVAIHLLAGILVGWWASVLPRKIQKWKSDPANIIPAGELTVDMIPSKKRRPRRKWLFIVWILLIGLYVQSYYRLGNPLLPADLALKILLRSLIVVLAWIFVVGPLLRQVLHGWLRNKQTRSRQDMESVLRLLPLTRHLIVTSWAKAARKKGFSRIPETLKMVFVNSLAPASVEAGRPDSLSPAVYMLTGPIQSGKTTRLLQWARERKDVAGILSPVIDGKRMFVNVKTGEQFPMEAAAGEQEVLLVGRFRFSRRNFERACEVIREGMNAKGWLIIDEIGPLELEGKGFASLLRELLRSGRSQVLLIVREGWTEKVAAFFGVRAIAIREPEEAILRRGR